jgi:hypothetical protein
LPRTPQHRDAPAESHQTPDQAARTGLFVPRRDLSGEARPLADSAHVEVPADLVRQAGFGVRVRITAAAWQRYVAWNDEDSDRLWAQEEQIRLLSLLAAVHCAFRSNATAHRVMAKLLFLPRRGTRAGVHGSAAAVLAQDPDGAAAVTIGEPGEI